MKGVLRKSAVWLMFLMGIGGAGYLASMPICNLIFQCGCRAPWAGGAEHCRYMPGMAGVEYPCPWCDSPGWLLLSLFALAVVTSSTAAIFASRRWGLLVGWLAAAAAFMLFVVLEGILHGLAVGYPYGLPGLFGG